MSTPQNRLRDRLKGHRQSTNIENRRGQTMPDDVAPGDSIGMRPGSLKRPVRIPFGKDETKVPVEKARVDFAMSQVSGMKPIEPLRRMPLRRRKRKIPL